MFNCKSPQKTAYNPNITGFDVTMTCIDSIQSLNDLFLINIQICIFFSKLSFNAYPLTLKFNCKCKL